MDGDTFENVIGAIRNSRTDIVRLLIEVCEKESLEIDGDKSKLTLNVLLNSLCNDSGTLLHFATKLGNVDIVRTLLAVGADPSIRNNVGDTSFDLAETDNMATVFVDELLRCAANSDVEGIRNLISSGVPVNSQDSASSANTALHWAATFGTPNAVQCLLDCGAMVDIPNADGVTPLHDAVARKDANIVKQLLDAGADPMVKSLRGKYAGQNSLDLAGDDSEITTLLMAAINSSALNSSGIVNGNVSVSSSSLESLRIENGLADDVGRLSVTSVDTPVKHNMASYVTQTSTLPPFPQLTSPPLLITDTKLHLLWPLPQHITQMEEPCFKLRDKYSVSIVQDADKSYGTEIINVWKVHQENFMCLGVDCSIEDIVPHSSPPNGDIIFHVSDRLFPRPESYKIIITTEQLRILAADLPGLHYGLSTLCQLFNLYQGEDGIPSLFIEDWPVLRHRAVLFDMVPGARKPNMETLKGIIKVLSTLKLNELHFYFKVGSKNESKWPYCNCDLIEMTHFCRQHFIVPVLTIDVFPGTLLEDVNDCLQHVQTLMYLFSSKKIHIGPHLSKFVLEDSMKQSFTFQLREILNVPSDCTVQLCCNGHSMNTKLLNSMPLNVVLVEFGYQADYDYDSPVESIVTSGLPIIIGVGTSSWASIAGYPESAINNIHKAAQSASCKGALGLLIADWKTAAHHPALCFSWPGILVAAGLSWNDSIHLDFLHTRLPELLNHHIFFDNEQLVGYLTVELGRLEAFIHHATQNSKVGSQPRHQLTSSILHQFLIDPDTVSLDSFSADLLQQAVRHLKKFESDLQKAKPNCFQKGELVAELQLAVDLMLFTCRLAKVMVSNGSKPFPDVCGLDVVNIGISNLPPIAKTDLANRLLALIEQFRGVWLSRNLPCGLHESLYLFNALLHKLIPNSEHFFASADGFVRQ